MHPRRLTLNAIAFGSVVWGVSPLVSADEPFLIAVGGLPGQSPSSDLFSVSPDGRFACGSARAPGGTHAILWELGVGLTDLGDLPGPPISNGGFDLTLDATIVVGSGFNQAVIWDSMGPHAIGDMPDGSPTRTAEAITPDGSVFVGRALAGAFRQVGQVREPLYDAQLFIGLSDATDVSSDGLVVIGQGNECHEFLWESGEFTCMPGTFDAVRATAITPDGDTVVGTYTVNGLNTAFHWNNGIRTDLLPLPGDDETTACDISADGRFIVGDSESGKACTAVIWVDGGQPIPIEEYLTNTIGLDTIGWFLEIVSGISDDGTTLIGCGTAPGIPQTQGWVAFMGSATSCLGDCDNSGTVDFNDLVSMLFEFDGSNAVCDADGSGTVDFNDLVAALFLFGPCEAP